MEQFFFGGGSDVWTMSEFIFLWTSSIVHVFDFLAELL